jgi:hypothetical protein
MKKHFSATKYLPIALARAAFLPRTRHRHSPSSQVGALAFRPGMVRHCISYRPTAAVIARTRGLLTTVP